MNSNELNIIAKTSIDQSGLISGLKESEKIISTAETSDDLKLKIDAAIDTSDTVKSVAELKKSLKDLKSLALQVGDTSSDDFKRISNAIAETNDRMGDMNELVRSSTGEPIERLSNSFQGVGNSLKNLDFKQAKAQLGIFSDTVKSSTKELFGGVNVLKTYKTAMQAGSTSTQALTTATKGFGKALAATGIGLIVIAVAALITNFDKLKSSGGAVGKILTWIGNITDTVIGKLKALSDFIGLTDFAQEEANAKAIKGAKDRQAATVAAYDQEIAKAAAAGKSTIDWERGKNKFLAKSNEERIAMLDKESKANKGLSDEKQKERDELVQGTKEANNAIEVLNIKQRKEKADADKKAAEEGKKNSDKANGDAKAATEKHLSDLKSINDKYFVDDRKKIENEYDEALSKLNQKNEKELALYNELLMKKSAALLVYDNELIEKEKATAKEQISILEKNQETQESMIKDFGISILKIDDDFASERLKDMDATDEEIYKKLQTRYSKEKELAELKINSDLIRRDNEIKAIEVSLQDTSDLTIKEVDELNQSLIDKRRELLAEEERLELLSVKSGEEYDQMRLNIKSKYVNLRSELDNKERDNNRKTIEETKKSADTVIASLSKISLEAGKASILPPSFFETLSKGNQAFAVFADEGSKAIDKVKAVMEVGSSAISAISDMMNNQTQKQLEDLKLQTDAINSKYDSEKSAIEDRYNREIEAAKAAGADTEAIEKRKETAVKNSEEAKKKELRKTDAERVRVEKLAFERNKKTQIAMAIANGAMAVTNILATTIDPTGVYKAILIGAAAVTTAAQIATIAKQQYAGGGGGSSAPDAPGSIFSGAQPLSAAQSSGIGQTQIGIAQQQLDYKVYVTSDDITAAQRRDNQIIGKAQIP